MCTIQITGIEAKDVEQAQQVATALQTIYNILGTKDTIELAALLAEKPGLVQKAKQYKKLL